MHSNRGPMAACESLLEMFRRVHVSFVVAYVSMLCRGWHQRRLLREIISCRELSNWNRHLASTSPAVPLNTSDKHSTRTHSPGAACYWQCFVH